MTKERRSNTVTIIHFRDILLYPPALNLFRYFADSNKFKKVVLCSQTDYNDNLTSAKYYNTTQQNSTNKFVRLISYLWFYLYVFSVLIITHPDDIIYYESLSFPPVYYYQKIRKKVGVYCHNHEYDTMQEYREGMSLNKWAHDLELKCYNSFQWISHTNPERIDLFLKEYPSINTSIVHSMPNHPPKLWSEIAKAHEKDKAGYPLKLVYVGALGMEDMYLKELCLWVVNQNGTITLDIYTGTNTSKQVQDFFFTLNTSYISLRGKVPYDDLPKILPAYNIGVIIYKCKTLNVIYSEPNKFFEYYVCGLDIWYPKEMISMKKNITSDSSPKIVEVDFQNLLPVEHYYSKNIKKQYKADYNAESNYMELLNKICS